VLIAGGLSLPRLVWEGEALKEIKGGMHARGTTLDSLTAAWAEIDPEQLHIEGRHILLMLSKHDTAIGPKNSAALNERLAQGNSVKAIEFPYGHSGTVARSLIMHKHIYTLFGVRETEALGEKPAIDMDFPRLRRSLK
jgi:hypothetical protein